MNNNNVKVVIQNVTTNKTPGQDSSIAEYPQNALREMNTNTS
jgi:hypothetical protein